MEESFAIIEKDVEALKEKTKKISQKVKDLEASVDYHDQDIGDLQGGVKGLWHDVDNLKVRLLSHGHYSRRENLIFIGIEEEDGTQGDEKNSTVSNQNTENRKRGHLQFYGTRATSPKRSMKNKITARSPGSER